MNYIAQKDQVLSWLAKLAEKYTMLAPKAIAKSTLYQEYTAEELAKANLADLLDYTTSSAKDAYIPQSETLFKYTSTKNPEDLSKVDTKLECSYSTNQSIIFGARPCDAKGVLVQDAAYLGGRYRDPYYAARRENTFLITQTCNQALPSCFCNWTDTDLTSAYASDVLFSVTDKGYVFEAVTEKGKELLEVAGFAQASDDDNKDVEALRAKAHESLPQKPDLSDLPQKVAYNFENSVLWSKVSAGCIGCSSCTFVCPTCQCFTITDEGNPLEGKRIRSWASCMADEFTREASGHNPRPAGYTRWRNRLGHKFNYMTAWHKDLYSCTGCGRCLLSCPASISIKDIISGVLEATPADAALPPARKHYESFAQQSAEAPAKEKEAPKKTAPSKKQNKQ